MARTELKKRQKDSKEDHARAKKRLKRSQNPWLYQGELTEHLRRTKDTRITEYLIRRAPGKSDIVHNEVNPQVPEPPRQGVKPAELLNRSMKEFFKPSRAPQINEPCIGPTSEGSQIKMNQSFVKFPR